MKQETTTGSVGCAGGVADQATRTTRASPQHVLFARKVHPQSRYWLILVQQAHHRNGRIKLELFCRDRYYRSMLTKLPYSTTATILFWRIVNEHYAKILAIRYGDRIIMHCFVPSPLLTVHSSSPLSSSASLPCDCHLPTMGLLCTVIAWLIHRCKLTLKQMTGCCPAGRSIVQDCRDCTRPFLRHLGWRSNKP